MSFHIQIYMKEFCPYSQRAVALIKSFKNKNIDIIDISLSKSNRKRFDMLCEKYHFHTVPQIFVNNQYVGDCSVVENLSKSKQQKLFS